MMMLAQRASIHIFGMHKVGLVTAAVAAQLSVRFTVVLFVTLQPTHNSLHSVCAGIPSHTIPNNFAFDSFFCVVKVSAMDVALSSSTVPVILQVIVLEPWQSVTSCDQKRVFLALSQCFSGCHRKRK